MLDIGEIHHLSYIYLLYRSLDIGLPYWKLTKEHLFVHVQSLLTERTGSLGCCSTEQLELYCEDLARAIANVPTPFSFKEQAQERSLRNRIAFNHVIEAGRKEGTSHITEDTLLIGQFAAIAGISQDMARAFFEHLIETIDNGIRATLKAVS